MLCVNLNERGRALSGNQTTLIENKQTSVAPEPFASFWAIMTPLMLRSVNFSNRAEQTSRVLRDTLPCTFAPARRVDRCDAGLLRLRRPNKEHEGMHRFDRKADGRPQSRGAENALRDRFKDFMFSVITSIQNISSHAWCMKSRFCVRISVITVRPLSNSEL